VAILDFKDFIDESIRVNETVNLDQILNLNLNIELLFDKTTETKDEELNKLIGEAKERFLKPDDQNVALEKLWDAFERIKTYYDPNKKKSANRLIDQISIDLDREIFAKEFEMLTNIQISGTTIGLGIMRPTKNLLIQPIKLTISFFACCR
jgi:hypothetical protein